MSEPRLEVNDGLGRRVIPIDKPTLTIGRRTESDVRLVGSDVSREHAEIASEDGHLVLRDRGSRYGTFVNGAPVSEHRLTHGDRVQFGRTGGAEVVFLTEASLSASGTSSAGTAVGDIRQMATLLEGLRALGSGRVLDINAPESAAVFDRKGITPREALAPLTRLLLTWLIGVLMLDIAVRRIAWDRWLTRAFRPDLAATALRAEAARAGRAAASIGGLRATLEAQPTPASADALPTVTTSDSLALGNEDAASLVKAARDRRRAQRLGEMREIETPSATQRVPQVQAEPPTHTDASADGGLLAAKRRALDKFREGDAR